MNNLYEHQKVLLREISRLISKGFIESNDPQFRLELIDTDHNDTEAMQHIAHLVSQGYTEGYHPRWVFKTSEEALKDLF